MAQALVEAAERLRVQLGELDPALIDGDGCARLVAALSSVEKACAAARARLAARAAECGAARRAGFADAADWLARQTGTSRGRAQAELDTADALRELPHTASAVTSGELSLSQAAEIAKAASGAANDDERAELERELLEVALHHSLRALQDKSRQTRHDRIDPDELHRRQHAARYVRHWRDDLGMIRIDAALPPEEGIPLVNRLDNETKRCMREAAREPVGSETRETQETPVRPTRPEKPARTPRAGRAAEKWEAHAADALVTILAGGGRSTKVNAEIVYVCDINARRRGHTHPGEVCHIVGGGPIPVDVVMDAEADAFLKAVLHDGVMIHTVKHFGRYRKAELRTAIELGAPPQFDGVECSQHGCDRRYGLQWDHLHPVVAGGETSRENLDPKCRPHHKDKSDAERAAGVYATGRQAAQAGDASHPP